MKKLVELLQNESDKIPKAKNLICSYKELLAKKDNETEKLKKDNQELYLSIDKLPKIIKKYLLKK